MSDWIETISSAWTGHRNFATWLVQRLRPKTVVDLGVDQGYSTFVFANALAGSHGTVYGVDLFQGDEHAGFRNTYDSVMHLLHTHSVTNIEIIQSDFNELCKTWNKPIQILHIDGLHTYEAVKNDFEKWHRFVEQDGVILFHDTVAFASTVGQFFYEIQGYHKMSFHHSAGLGVITKNTVLFNEIQQFRV